MRTLTWERDKAKLASPVKASLDTAITNNGGLLRNIGVFEKPLFRHGRPELSFKAWCVA
jgi:hypothetical protein